MPLVDRDVEKCSEADDVFFRGLGKESLERVDQPRLRKAFLWQSGCRVPAHQKGFIAATKAPMVVIVEFNHEDVLGRPRVDASGDLAEAKNALAVGDERRFRRRHLQYLSRPARLPKWDWLCKSERHINRSPFRLREEHSSD